jgi:hypothetical protein
MSWRLGLRTLCMGFVLGCMVLSSGCLYVPVPGPIEGTLVQEETLEGLLGSSKLEVRNHLGDPQIDLEDPDKGRSYSVYAGASSFGYLIATDGRTGGVMDWASTTYQCTLLQFDADDRLTRFLVVFRESGGDCLRELWRLSDSP